MRMTLWKIVCAGLVALLLAHHASAQDTNRCDAPHTQMEINACAAERYAEVDAELNDIYRKAMSKLNDEGKAQLRAVQRVWIQFRDAHCRFETSEASGTSMHPTLHYGCLTSVTETRIEQLRKYLDDLSTQ